jgi:hypothetical protein
MEVFSMNIRRYVGIITLALATSIAFGAEPAVDKDGWQSLFDGKTMGKWNPADFSSNGKIEVKDGSIQIGIGKPMSGIVWSNEPPARMDYEIQLEAMRTEGSDFFCGLTFPVGTNPCTFVVGGWGGAITGLSSIDGYDASENETSSSTKYENNRWYKIRVKVSKSKIEAWIDDKQMVNFETENRRISVRWEMEPSIPLGMATWCTGSAVRNIKIRKYGG